MQKLLLEARGTGLVRSNLGRWPDHLCAVCRHYHHLLHLLLLLPVQDVPPTTSGCHHHHIHHCGACPLSSASKCAAQLPWTKLPGLPHHATSARDASSTLPNAVPTTLPGPTHGPAGLPRDPGWRSSRALPCQPASLQPGLRGCPEGGPLSVLRPLWLPLGYVVCRCPIVSWSLCRACWGSGSLLMPEHLRQSPPHLRVVCLDCPLSLHLPWDHPEGHIHTQPSCPQGALLPLLALPFPQLI
uniref:Shisa family member 5 n=1 Tax=Theropithecus gelada TaxID=9565 RepID=A0A8D2EVD5_THEGE